MTPTRRHRRARHDRDHEVLRRWTTRWSAVQPMFADRNIIENAVNSADHETLVAAVKAAGLVETLSGEGPFTVFAPTDAAFGMLREGAVESPAPRISSRRS